MIEDVRVEQEEYQGLLDANDLRLLHNNDLKDRLMDLQKVLESQNQQHPKLEMLKSFNEVLNDDKPVYKKVLKYGVDVSEGLWFVLDMLKVGGDAPLAFTGTSTSLINIANSISKMRAHSKKEANIQAITENHEKHTRDTATIISGLIGLGSLATSVYCIAQYYLSTPEVEQDPEISESKTAATATAILLIARYFSDGIGKCLGAGFEQLSKRINNYGKQPEDISKEDYNKKINLIEACLSYKKNRDEIVNLLASNKLIKEVEIDTFKGLLDIAIVKSLMDKHRSLGDHVNTQGRNDNTYLNEMKEKMQSEIKNIESIKSKKDEESLKMNAVNRKNKISNQFEQNNTLDN